MRSQSTYFICNNDVISLICRHKYVRANFVVIVIFFLNSAVLFNTFLYVNEGGMVADKGYGTWKKYGDKTQQKWLFFAVLTFIVIYTNNFKRPKLSSKC